MIEDRQVDSPCEKKKKGSTNKCNSVEQQLATMSTTLLAMQEIMVKNGLTPNMASCQESGESFGDQHKVIRTKGQSDHKSQPGEGITSSSVTTIYQNALNKELSSDQPTDVEIFRADSEIAFKLKAADLGGKRDSSSSEEDRVDTSDEFMEDLDGHNNTINVDNFIADCETEANRRRQSMTASNKEVRNTGHEQADEIIHEAEASKARILATQGNCHRRLSLLNRYNGNSAMQHSSLVDENYMSIGGNIDVTLRDKIVRGDYVDFSRLLPRVKQACDENRLELINRGGQTYFVLANRDQNGTINNFHKWEQAFRVFSNIYMREHPDRASELIQYNHIMCSAASTFTWENVYSYDREFRTHLSFYPECRWSIILQQAWSMCLKDRLEYNHGPARFGNHSKSKKEVCQHFNRGQCMAGRNCKYEHKCLECGKFGHGEHICRRKNGKKGCIAI